MITHPLLFSVVKGQLPPILKRNANAFSLNAIVEFRGLRRRLRRRHGVILFEYLGKFTTTYPTVVLTFRPEMASQSTSGRQLIQQRCQFWVMFGLQFLDNGSTDS